MSEPEIKPRKGVGDLGMEEAGREEGKGIPRMMAKGGPRTHSDEAQGHQEGCGMGIKGGLPSWKNYGKFETRLPENTKKKKARQLSSPRKTKSCTEKKKKSNSSGL